MERKLSIIGSGVYNLDTVVVRDYPEGPQNQRNFNEKVICEDVGGTCGNVMCMLSHLGWDAYPQVVLDCSEQGARLADGLASYGCRPDFVENRPDGGTVLLRCTHKQDKDGNHVATFRATGPASRFAKRHPLRERDEAPAFLESLSFVPDVYFFDLDAAGHRRIAAALREKGSLVYFEPERFEGKNTEMTCVKVSDIVKFSGEKVADTSFCGAFSDKLFIQTLGSEGVRFSLRGGEWVSLPPVPVEKVVDWEGAGDWTTSAFIDALGKSGSLSMASLTEDRVKDALMEAQKVASRSVGYMAPKGMIRQY